MAWQSRRIAATLPVPWRWSGALSSGGRRATAPGCSPRPALTSGCAARPAAQWFREYMTYDPAADLVTISRPGLAVTGGKDVKSIRPTWRRSGGWSLGRSRVTRLMTSHMSCAAINTRPGCAATRDNCANPLTLTSSSTSRHGRGAAVVMDPPAERQPDSGPVRAGASAHCAYGPRPPWSRLLTDRRRVPSDSGPAATAPTPRAARASDRRHDVEGDRIDYSGRLDGCPRLGDMRLPLRRCEGAVRKGRRGGSDRIAPARRAPNRSRRHPLARVR